MDSSLYGFVTGHCKNTLNEPDSNVSGDFANVSNTLAANTEEVKNNLQRGISTTRLHAC